MLKVAETQKNAKEFTQICQRQEDVGNFHILHLRFPQSLVFICLDIFSVGRRAPGKKTCGLLPI